ncbi:MAG: T9SS type A sorting domain-containing protein [Sphingobacteriales bacterium]|nr:MAG: T9SS type A sorting domain-containing protein [Sphingobacteriales bacterium]
MRIRRFFSKAVQIKVNAKVAGFYLRLNPVDDQLFLVNENLLRVMRLQVTDLSGRILLDRKIESADGVIRTNVGTLQNGYYLLKIRSDRTDLVIP